MQGSIAIPYIDHFDFDQNAGPLLPHLPWILLTEGGERICSMQTRIKLAWSDNGLFVVAESEDHYLTCMHRNDFDDLFNDDVVEIFLQPDPAVPLYFEYEVSPLGAELALLVSNNQGTFMGWRPWHYEGDRKIQKRVAVTGGKQEPGTEVDSWRTEFFIPFKLFKGLSGCPPKTGTAWRGNVCRMDFDQTPCAKWLLFKQINGQFHNFQEFGKFIFE